MPAESDQGEPTPASHAKQTRTFIRALVATSYLLGTRRQALGAGVVLSEPLARQALVEITEQLSHGVQEYRARILAAEVGRLMRSLGVQRLK